MKPNSGRILKPGIFLSGRWEGQPDLSNLVFWWAMGKLRLEHQFYFNMARKARQRRQAIQNVANALGGTAQTNDDGT